MRKVLQISKYYFPFLGGTEQVARDIAKALKHYEDVEQKIICFNEDAKLEGYVNHHEETVCEEVDGVEVIRCGYVAKYASQALSTSYGKELKKVITGFDPDLIILHYPNPFVTYYLLRYIPSHCKLAVYWHLDITKQKILKHFFNGQNKKLIARSSKILGATPVHVNESAYSEIMGAKKYVLPYAIDEKRLVISDDEIKVAMDIRKKYEGKILGFFIGRHVPYKGLQYLLEASACMRGDKMHFLIAGTGELTQELKSLSANDSKVEFVGRVTDSQWRSYLYACDIFCFPSITRNEGFGLAQAEAMYYGKPVVTFTIPGSGVNFVTQNGITGIECPNSDSMAYADALLRLANDPELRKKMGDAGRQRVLDNFTEAQFVKNVGKLLDDVL